jgi:thioredoxin-like negative regulator of GroEL
MRKGLFLLVALLLAWTTTLNSGETKKMKTLLVFGAPWCSACTAIHKSMKDPKAVEALKNYNVIEVDTDKNKELTQKYGVDALPTLVIVSPANKVVKKQAGLQTPSQLQNWLK